MPMPNTMRQMTDTGGKLGAKKANRTIQARKAREQFMYGGSRRDTNIIRSIKSLFTPKTQQEKQPAGFSYGGGYKDKTSKLALILSSTLSTLFTWVFKSFNSLIKSSASSLLFQKLGSSLLVCNSSIFSFFVVKSK